MQTNRTLLKLEQYSKNINIAIGLAEYKLVECGNIDITKKIHKYIYKKQGQFKQYPSFLWKCSYTYLHKYNFETAWIYIYKRIDNKYKKDIYLSLYDVLIKIFCKDIVKLNVRIIWIRSYIKLTTHINISND